MNNEMSNCKEETCCTPATAESKAWVRPHYELDRNDEAFRLRVYVPGAKRSTVSLSVDDGVLHLSAERADAPSADWKPLSRELSHRDYRLEVRVPEKVDVAAIKATVEDGILSLTLPIREADKPRSIEVQ
jgi:HSP20 family protein